MATHAHSTRTPLLRLIGEGDRLTFQPIHRSPQPLLGRGLGRQPGPVTQAIRAMRSADPVLDPRQFTHGIRALSRTEVENLVEGLIDLLDAMDGDTDREADFVDRRRGRDGRLYTIGCTSDDEPSLCGLMVQSPGGLGDDREYDEAERCGPIPDWSGHGVHEAFVGRRA